MVVHYIRNDFLAHMYVSVLFRSYYGRWFCLRSAVCGPNRVRFVSLRGMLLEMVSLYISFTFLLLSIRGELNSFIQIYCYSGILCGFIGGTYLSYVTNPLAMISLPLLFVCAFAFMPETPQYLLSVNKIDVRHFLYRQLNIPMLY